MQNLKFTLSLLLNTNVWIAELVNIINWLSLTVVSVSLSVITINTKLQYEYQYEYDYEYDYCRLK